jgi:hypothetical protein
MPEWQRDALAAGFNIDALAFIADFVARGVVAIDGTPVEEVPGYWVIPGFVPYDGRIILATADRRRIRDDRNAAAELSTILARAVAGDRGPGAS